MTSYRRSCTPTAEDLPLGGKTGGRSIKSADGLLAACWCSFLPSSGIFTLARTLHTTTCIALYCSQYLHRSRLVEAATNTHGQLDMSNCGVH
jgi:hypothetical protein